MHNKLIKNIGVCAVVALLSFVIGYQTGVQSPKHQTPVAAQAAPAPKMTQGVIRIKAGLDSPLTDSSGNLWQAELGFNGGIVYTNDDPLVVSNTPDSALFRSEHYSMETFSIALPNGKYVAKLYFAETYGGITGPGQRVFSFNVQGHKFKDFDIWVKAGGLNRAYGETVPVEVTNGKFTITFTPNVENPKINAIEIDQQN